MSEQPRQALKPHVSERRPTILFFSGGSAMNPVAKALKRYPIDSTHLLHPFDSGGSSGELRRRFNIPAVGDLRSRLLAVCDQSDPHTAAMHAVLSYRFPKSADSPALGEHLHGTLEALLEQHPILATHPASDELRQLMTSLKRYANFDLSGASIGNLALTAAYFRHHHSLMQATRQVASWMRLCGHVRCTVNTDLHLAARLADGSTVYGQHRMTGKEHQPLSSAIEDMWLVDPQDHTKQARCRINADIKRLIRTADMLVFSPGSFHTSLMAHFLPEGVTSAIAENAGTKVYIPNLGQDPELIDRTPAQALAMLQNRLGHAKAITHILADPSQVVDLGRIDEKIRLIQAPLRSDQGTTHNPDAVCDALLELSRAL